MSDTLSTPPSAMPVPSLQTLMFAESMVPGFWPGCPAPDMMEVLCCYVIITSFHFVIPLLLSVLILFHLIHLTQVPCLRNGAATTFNLGDLHGKFVLLLFQPVDFGYIGPTELELLDNLGSDCEVLHHIDNIFVLS